MSEQPTPRALRTRFVTLCQQLLALAVVLAVLTPAARTITMDVRPMPLGGESSAAAPATLSAYVRASVTPSVVPAGPVHAKVATYALGATSRSTFAPRVSPRGGTSILTRALPVKDFGAVGVTWAPGQSVRWSDLTIQARTRTGTTWTGWTSLGRDDISPDAGTAEARDERPGTEALFVGHVDRVQVRVTSRRATPSGLRLSVIDPGTPARTRLERPAIDTSQLDGTAGDQQAVLRRTTTPTSTTTTTTTTPATSTLTAAGVTPKPQIYSRAQWGADESMRDPSSLHYGQVHAGFIHHTVQANNYTRDQVPALIRADYYYHTQVRGWSDIGYNYLVDRFGRIWEGRYGGVDRDPVGAHTLGYNDDSFAASAIGNYQEVQPTTAMVQAYAALFAWKLSLAGVKAGSTHQWVTKRYFNAINGHRDAGQTLCPGKYLYAKIPTIRTLATQIQASWAERGLHSDLAGSSGPDLIARRTNDGEGMILPITVNSDGVPKLGTPIDTGIDLTGATTVLKVGDWDGDGHGDVVVRRKADPQDLYLYRGTGRGTFAAPTLLTSAMRGVQMLAAVGDFTGDGHPDLMGETSTGPMWLFPGYGTAGVGRGYAVYGHLAVRKQMGVGRWDADGAPDVLVRTSSSTLTMYYGNGPGLIRGTQTLAFDASPYDQVVAVSSANDDGHTDLVVRDLAGRMWVVPGTTSRTPRTPIPVGYAKGYNLFG
ncbi:FG-GAP-like repeat-containing protein [Nocardioides ultimimeridianus]